MKKFRKLIVALLAMAMVIGCFAVQASAAETYLYVTGAFCGWGWGEDSGVLTSTDGNIYTGDIDVTGNSEIAIKTVANWVNDADKVKYVYNGNETFQTSVTFESAGTYTLTYNMTTKELTTQVKNAITINWTYEYFVAADPALGANDWTGGDAKIIAETGKMTADGDKYTLTTTATGTASEFCVIKYGTPDVEDIDNSIEWLKQPNTDPAANFKIADEVVAGSTVKITYNPADGTCEVVVTAPQTGSGSDSDAGNTGSGSDSDAGNTGSGSDSDAGNTGSGSDSDAGDTGSGSGNKPEISDNSVTQEEIDAMKDSVKVEGTTEKLVVSPITKDAADLKVVEAAVAKELKGVKYVVADLKFESGKQPTAGTKITIDVTKMADVKAAKYVAVYSVKDAKLELVDTVEVKDGKITFAPKHFSTYVFAEATDPKSDPDSGIVNTAVIVSAIAMLAAATVIVASKKRVTE